jgi:hypothetical protein
MTTVIRSETHPAVDSYGSVNRDVLKLLSPWGRTYKIVFAFVLAVLAAGLFAFGFMVYTGMGVAGLTSPVGWGVFITNFVFWVGIAHSGTGTGSVDACRHTAGGRPRRCRREDVSTSLGRLCRNHTAWNPPSHNSPPLQL